MLIVETKAQRQLVAHACGASLKAGVRVGMTLTHARALVVSGNPLVAEHEPHKDVSGLHMLARWATRWSPVVSADPPDGLLMDITGCGHLFGGDRGLATSLGAALTRLRLSARLAVAPTVGAAYATARYAPGRLTVIEPGGERAMLESLPIIALRLDVKAMESLAELGVVRVGQLLALPRVQLPSRYGAAVVRRIDQALGVEPEHIGREVDMPGFRASLELPGGTTQYEAIVSAIRLALSDLARQLERHESGLRQLDAVFSRLDAKTITITVQVSRPARSAKHLWRLLEPKVERLHLGFGIEGITLLAGRVARMAHRQAVLIEDRTGAMHDERASAETLDTIANRIGHDRLYRARLRESHRPERASVMVPVYTLKSDAAPHRASVAHTHAPRPSCLYESPQPARVVALSPDGPVMMLTRDDQDHRIITSIGPERIGGEWWRSREASRDYFRVQDEAGRWLWIYRVNRSGAWFVHGEWI